MTYPKYNELESLTKLDVWINLRIILLIIFFGLLEFCTHALLLFLDI